MSSVDRQISLNAIADILGVIRKKGVRLWAENGHLRYRAPKGSLSEHEIERLRTCRNEIVNLLEGVTNGSAETQLEPRLGRAPASFSQLAHWNLYRLAERSAIRQIASATRLRGALDIVTLRNSVTRTVARHDALRTRVVVCDGAPTQEIDGSSDCELPLIDLSRLTASSREVQIQNQVEKLMLEPIDVAVGPLLGIQLLKLHADEHVLVVAMEHMISDEFSMNIFLRDLLATYTELMQGSPPSLPPVHVQFSDYAVWQANSHESWISKHGAYWKKRLQGCQRVTFPEDMNSISPTNRGWAKIPLRIERDLKTELLEWSRMKKTTLVMSVFTAYTALVFRWCNVSDVVIQYQSDGRVSPKLENTIGFFAAVLYLRMTLSDEDGFLDVTHRAKEEYCKAYEHADASYMEAQTPRPEFTRNTRFNWVPEGGKINLVQTGAPADTIVCSPISFEHPTLKFTEKDGEPMILLWDSGDEIVGGVHFPANRFSVANMERFGRNFLWFLRVLLTEPGRRVKDIMLIR